MNRICIIGNVGQAPEVRTFDNGGKLVSFSVATSEHYKDKQGEKQTITEWHNVQFNQPKMVELIEKYVTKGMKVCIEGSMKSYTSGEGDSQKKYWNVRGERIEFLSKSESTDKDSFLQDLDNPPF